MDLRQKIPYAIVALFQGVGPPQQLLGAIGFAVLLVKPSQKSVGIVVVGTDRQFRLEVLHGPFGIAGVEQRHAQLRVQQGKLAVGLRGLLKSPQRSLIVFLGQLNRPGDQARLGRLVGREGLLHQSIGGVDTPDADVSRAERVGGGSIRRISRDDFFEGRDTGVQFLQFEQAEAV